MSEIKAFQCTICGKWGGRRETRRCIQEHVGGRNVKAVWQNTKKTGIELTGGRNEKGDNNR